MVKSHRPPAHENSSPGPSAPADRRLALLIAAVTLGLLLREVVTGLLAGDAGEFHFAAWRWGLAHPTGYPLYMLVGGAWQHLWALLGVGPAWTLNMLSAVFTAAAAGLFYLLLRRWLAAATAAPMLVTQLAAGLGVAFLVANPTLRTQSIQAEVYSLHLLLIVAILHAAACVAAPHVGVWTERVALLPAHPLVLLGLLVGLSLAHHATTVLLLPPLLAYLMLARRGWWRPPYALLWAGLTLVLPLLLYLYIPLRSGPEASPWYHQRLGDGVLTLYAGGWQAFVDFVSGRSISAGIYPAVAAWANLPVAGWLWLRHFEWPGLLLLALGLGVLLQRRQWPLLALTLGYVALHQVFNLFYAIGDIFVYYIPLYLVGCIWISFGAAGIGTAFRVSPVRGAGQEMRVGEGGGAGATHEAPAQVWSIVLLLVLFWAPAQIWLQYSPLPAQLQAESDGARAMWETILGAQPPADAVLVSNDRNEIVPLFYLQTIEGRGVGMTGLFPLIAPDARFADVGATVQTALAAGASATTPQPIYLIKPMPGLEARFALLPAAPPLVQVVGPAAVAPPQQTVDAAYGPLRLLGYDLDVGASAGEVTITLHWQVVERPAADYTTTVQLFDAAGNKLAQDDRRPGGDYYPTNLWKPGETLLGRHTLVLPAGAPPVRLLAAMYSGPDAKLLVPALEIEITPPTAART